MITPYKKAFIVLILAVTMETRIYCDGSTSSETGIQERFPCVRFSSLPAHVFSLRKVKPKRAGSDTELFVFLIRLLVRDDTEALKCCNAAALLEDSAVGSAGDAGA